jgi:hypothetical protein
LTVSIISNVWWSKIQANFTTFTIFQSVISNLKQLLLSACSYKFWEIAQTLFITLLFWGKFLSACSRVYLNIPIIADSVTRSSQSAGYIIKHLLNLYIDLMISKNIQWNRDGSKAERLPGMSKICSLKKSVIMWLDSSGKWAPPMMNCSGDPEFDERNNSWSKFIYLAAEIPWKPED